MNDFNVGDTIIVNSPSINWHEREGVVKSIREHQVDVVLEGRGGLQIWLHPYEIIVKKGPW